MFLLGICVIEKLRISKFKFVIFYKIVCLQRGQSIIERDIKLDWCEVCPVCLKGIACTIDLIF